MTPLVPRAAAPPRAPLRCGLRGPLGFTLRAWGGTLVAVFGVASAALGAGGVAPDCAKAGAAARVRDAARISFSIGFNSGYVRMPLAERGSLAGVWRHRWLRG